MTVLVTLSPAPGAPPSWVDLTPAAYHEAVRVTCKAIPGLVWQPKRKCYRGSRDAADAALAILVGADVVKIDDRTEPSPDAVTVYAVSNGLREYQQRGVGWLLEQLRRSGGALLADEMGLGKTAQAIAALDTLHAPPAELVCYSAEYDSMLALAQMIDLPRVQVVAPAVVGPHWRAELTRWSSRPDRYHVLSYEKAARAIRAGKLPAASALVLDEIHYMMNSKSGRSKAIRKWLDGQSPRPIVIGLSGTPMTARPRDLINPLDLLWPGRFGSWWRFTSRYCDGHREEIPGLDQSVWVSDGSSHTSELSQRLASCMLRRTKAEVGSDLPPQTRVVIEIDLPPAAARDARRAAAAADWAGGRHGPGVSALLSGLETYKLDAARQLAADAIASGSRPLVLTTRKATARTLAVALDAPCVTGETPAAKRAEILSDIPCGVATMYAINTGIDLVGFDTVIFVGLDWLPSTLLQAEARVHRIGQSKPVMIYYLVGARTLDEVVRERVIDRLHTFAKLTGSAGGDESELAVDLTDGDEESLIAELVAVAKGIAK